MVVTLSGMSTDSIDPHPEKAESPMLLLLILMCGAPPHSVQLEHSTTVEDDVVVAAVEPAVEEEVAEAEVEVLEPTVLAPVEPVLVDEEATVEVLESVKKSKQVLLLGSQSHMVTPAAYNVALLHPLSSNAPVPMVVTPSGIRIETRLLHP